MTLGMYISKYYILKELHYSIVCNTCKNNLDNYYYECGKTQQIQDEYNTTIFVINCKLQSKCVVYTDRDCLISGTNDEKYPYNTWFSMVQTYNEEDMIKAILHAFHPLGVKFTNNIVENINLSTMDFYYSSFTIRLR